MDCTCVFPPDNSNNSDENNESGFDFDEDWEDQSLNEEDQDNFDYSVGETAIGRYGKLNVFMFIFGITLANYIPG